MFVFFSWFDIYDIYKTQGLFISLACLILVFCIPPFLPPGLFFFFLPQNMHLRIKC